MGSTPVHAPLFALDACYGEEQRAFVDALHVLAVAGGWCGDAWAYPDRVILVVCPIDRSVLRTLRVDFDGVVVTFGEDETHQMVTPLDPARPDVTVVAGRPVAELARAAADWVGREVWRPIVRYEWDRTTWLEWRLADTGGLVVLTGPGSTFGPPDRVVRVWGPEQRGRLVVTSDGMTGWAPEAERAERST